MWLYVKRLDHVRFIRPTPADGAVAVSAAQLGYLLEGINWRNPRHTWRPFRRRVIRLATSLQHIGRSR
jgi:transposase